MQRKLYSLIPALLLLFLSCNERISSNGEMAGLLSNIAINASNVENEFSSQTRLRYYDSLLHLNASGKDQIYAEYAKALSLAQLGEERDALPVFENLLHRFPENNTRARTRIMKDLALNWMRIGERVNCLNNHGSESCIFPISGSGVHQLTTGSKKAIDIYEEVLKQDPDDLESRWLLNIAYMTLGQYPQNVPSAFLIKGLETDTSYGVKPFVDAAINTGLNTNNMAGGSIVEDFNNDGYLDLVTSSWGLSEGMHYCRNNGDGTFTDVSNSSGLFQLTGGLHIMQTDYNNDGFKDIFVMRGAWLDKFGKEPNSLLKNNGDGTFTDVTRESGLLSFHPTQTATWADFNNDGWLDVFIGNESNRGYDLNPCELYINNKNGTFTEVAAIAGCDVIGFVKGVTSGDYNNDGFTDIFISTLNGQKILLKNEGLRNKKIKFSNVADQAGLAKNRSRTFPTWFWDYDNDGWLDILICSYDFNKPLSWYAAAEALKLSTEGAGKIFLYKNKKDGTFEEVSSGMGLNKIAFAMGSNFGDIDNDGYLDFYLGTGNPQYSSLVPNKMFRNVNGTGFIDITTSARVGNLQKGHGVAFADLDNDGDQDIYIEMGGAFVGDAYQNSLYINPGQNDNHWINISLEGVQCNRAAIGAKIKVTFQENNLRRSVYRVVNSGGSFGANPLKQHIGIGKAGSVEEVEIQWPGSNKVQIIKDLKADENVCIKEGIGLVSKVVLNKTNFTSYRAVIGCLPDHK